MTEITITEWKRYGDHRGYAEDAAGTKLGFVDLTTGNVILEDGTPAEPVTSQLLDWAATRSATPGQASGPQVASPTPLPIEPEWHDLAANRPGQLTRDKAQAAWEIEKDISKVGAYAGKAFRVHTPERAHRKGAEGEERVGPILDSLAKHGWRTLHSIPTGKHGDIDHLSIGPGGVVLFNTKYNHGAKFSSNASGVYVNGARTDYVPQIKDQARRAFEALKRAGAPAPFVTPWIVLVNGSVLQPEAELGPSPKGVSITTNWNLKINLRRMEKVLSQDQVDAIYDIARRSTTWS
jgi:hypothetical protein